MRSPCLTLILAAFVLVSRSLAVEGNQAAETFFHQSIEPILVAHCLECHGEARKGQLDLRTRATTLAGGDNGKVIEPGDVEGSLLYAYVSTSKMPPDNPLDANQIQAIKKWIDDGAYFPKQPLDPFAMTTEHRAGYDWWSLQPLNKVDVPDAHQLPESWQDNTIDRFVGTTLIDNGLQPSPPANPTALIRRATYDLIGLPPSPEQVGAFLSACREETGELNQVGEKAYLKLVDRLLESKHYGEQWGRHWLDIVRFGESNGFERNVIHNNVWPFRDYVIRSFNNDKPFDRLVLEHLAGDILGPEDPEVAVGTSFLVCGPYDNVGNQDAAAAAQIRANTIDELIRATSEAFLGLTVGCSRCHDHKFDPIAQRDYYRMYASFAGVQHGEREIQTKQNEEVLREIEIVKMQIRDIEEKLWPQFRPAVQASRNSEQFAPVDAKYVRFTVSATNSSEPCIDELEVYSVGTENSAPENVAAAAGGGKATSSGNYTGDVKHQLQHVNDGKYGNSRSWISDKNGSGWVQIEFIEQQPIDRIVWGRDREEKFVDRLATSYKVEVATEPGNWTVVASSADRIPLRYSHSTSESLLRHVLTNEQLEQAQPLVEELQRLENKAEQLRSKAAPPKWWVGNFQQVNGPFHVFIGGDPQRHGAEVNPSSLSAIAHSTHGYQLESDSPENERRLALAEWIVAKDNSLTPRVLANRLWHYHFGVGIVSTPSDFGFLGGLPSHPDLLNWLATTLKEDGWRLKPMHKRIMLSQTYRQASDFRAEAANVDGESRLLWRYPPRRLSGEEIRDSALVVTDKLDTRMGGPGFRLFRYVEDNVATYHPLDKHGPETYRRAVYHHNARAM
ncbi:MAG: DUF1549 domain-containing protein, partial [Aeoliella sp.]